jgi:hypothetical protein
MRFAYGLLVAGMCAIAFSISLGQLFFACMFPCLLTGLLLRRSIPRLPALAWLAFAFMVYALWTVARSPVAPGLPREALAVLWFLVLPATILLVTATARAAFLIKAFIVGCCIRAGVVLIIRPIAAMRDSRDFITALIDRGSMTDGQLLMLGVVATAAIIFIRRQQHRPCAVWMFALALETAGLIVNLKRGSWFCTVAVLLLMFLVRGGWKYCLLTTLAVCAMLLLPPVRVRLAQLPHDIQYAGGRTTMWFKIAPAMVRTHPVFGWGYSVLDAELLRRVDPGVEPERNHLHSNPVNIVVETGVTGLALYLLWMVVGVWQAGLAVVRQRAAHDDLPAIALAVAMMLLALFANGLVEYNFGDAELMLVYAALFGVLPVLRDPCQAVT